MNTNDDGVAGSSQTQHDGTVISPMNQTSFGIDRFAMLNIFIDSALEKISSGVSEEQYINLFKDLTAFGKSVPIKTHKKMKSCLMGSMKTEINTMIEEENVEEKLKQLDKIIDECAMEEGKETWRPNGCVEDHMRAHAIEVKIKQRDELEKTVRDMEHGTEALRLQVSTLRAQVRACEAKLHDIREKSLDCSDIDKLEAKIVERFRDFNV